MFLSEMLVEFGRWNYGQRWIGDYTSTLPHFAHDVVCAPSFLDS